MNFLAQETGYSGAFSETDTCSGIATIGPASGKGPSQSYTVTGVAAGTCSITIGDAFGQKASVSVSVTVGGFVITGHHRHR